MRTGRRRKTLQPSRRVLYAMALQKLGHDQVLSPDEARELRRNRMPDGSYPLVPLVRPAAAQ
jgi:hypothetical protein